MTNVNNHIEHLVDNHDVIAGISDQDGIVECRNGKYDPKYLDSKQSNA